jgi:hypothetical protein
MNSITCGMTVQTSERDHGKVVESNPRHPEYRAGFVAVAFPFAGVRYYPADALRPVYSPR